MCIRVCVFNCVQLFVTLNYRLLGFSVYGNFQAGILEEVVFPLPELYSQQKIEPCLLSLLY